MLACPVGWDCRIHQLPLCRGGKALSPNKYPGFDEVPVMLELWGLQSTTSLPSLPSPLWFRMVAPDKAQAMGQIEVNCVLILN